ncbi:MAG: BtpA/SgcQ family protein [Bryobacteraceae bacterium]|nr:BtpA/SgcQ family protein [Bryobacteraceae bacterium]MDW8379527.1 BtpA/SgcQ family protein [Bryobacterales bacterium]
MNWASFCAQKPVIGMLHVPALPGSPRNQLNFEEIFNWVIRDADTLVEGGVDGLLVENFGDVPFYPHQVPPHTVAFLTALAFTVRQRHRLPLGVNVLRNDGRSAMAIAAAVQADFVRVNILTGARLTDQGILEGNAHEITRDRLLLRAQVAILADVAVKHSAALADRPLEEEIEDTIHRGLADGIIITGPATGKAAPLEWLERAKKAAGQTPVFVGSGVNEGNVAKFLAVADGVIIGTYLKEAGVCHAPVALERVQRLRLAARGS